MASGDAATNTTLKEVGGRLRAVLMAITAIVLVGLVAACGSSSSASPGGSDAAGGGSSGTEVRLGFFPNVNHAPALIGAQEGTFAAALKPLGATVKPTLFNAGPEAVTALFSDSLDIAYIGPNPTVNAFVESKGEAVRVIAGAASGGAALVVKPGINSAAELKGKTLATPQLGNTQDVALRYWLKQQGITTNKDGGGDVSIKPQSNSEGLTAYGSGQIDGAWVPEPWVSEYVKKGAKVLVNENSLWPDGKFVTTNVIVRTKFLQEHPDLVAAFLSGHVATLKTIVADPGKAQADTIASLQELTGKAPAADVVASAWKQITFTSDPLQATLVASAQHAIEVGLLNPEEFDGAGDPTQLYDLEPLNKVLTSNGQPTVS